MRECQAEGCRTAARYNHPGQAVGALCNVHREEGMRNVMHKPCAEEGCFMQAGGGFDEEFVARFILRRAVM